MHEADNDGNVREPMTFEDFRRSFDYGDHADMQFRFLASMPDDLAADTVGDVLDRLGEALDAGDFGPVRDAVYAAQVGAYTADESAVMPNAPFTPIADDLARLRLALISAGAVLHVDGDDPMGSDGPTQEESLKLIKEFLRGTPTLSVSPRDTRR